MSRDDLLPCPFCGGKPKLQTQRCAEDAEVAFVTCQSCFASTDHFEDAYAPTADAVDRWNTRATPIPDTSAGERDDDTDPTSDERWQAGLDYAMEQFCHVLRVDPKDVTWDAATEELEGDVRAVIGNILRVKFGEDFDPRAAPSSPGERMREALADFATSAAFASRGALDSDTVFCEIYTPGYQPQKKGSFGFYVKDLRNLLALAALALQGPSGKTPGAVDE